MTTMRAAFQTVCLERRLPWRLTNWMDHQPRIARWREARRHARETRLFGRFIHPGDLVFDIGANIGDKTAIFLTHGASVVCVEPDSRNLTRLRERVGTSATIVPAGVGATLGTARFFEADAHARSSFAPDAIGDDCTYDEGHDVSVVTLDSLIGNFGAPAFIKIDVEGYEPAALAGLSQPVPALCFEFHRGLDDQRAACMDRLVSLGMARFNVLLYPVGGVPRYHALDRLFFPEPVDRATLDQLLTQWPERPLAGDVYAFRDGS